MEEQRIGASLRVHPRLYSHWGVLETYIAQLVLFTLLATILLNAALLRGSNSLWFIDNVPALMAMVNGTSPTATLEHMAKIAHLMLYAVRGQAYFEYVESDSNWADEISREGLKGAWAKNQGFSCTEREIPWDFLMLPNRAIILVCEFV